MALQIAVGQPVPAHVFHTLEGGHVVPKSTADILKGKKVVIFGIPGAFTPTCSTEHCPSYILNATRLKQGGVDAVYCTSTNDAFVLAAWAEKLGSGDRFGMLADGNGDFARAVGLSQDLTSRSMGVRSKRYVLYIVDGIVKHVGVDAPGSGIEQSGAEAVLKLLAAHPNL